MHHARTLLALTVPLMLVACAGDGSGGSGGGGGSSGSGGGGGSSGSGGGGGDSGSGGGGGGSGSGGGGGGGGSGTGEDAGTDTDSGTPPNCDYRVVDGIAVIEAESLPLAEDWVIATEMGGFSGSGYIEWTGTSHNNDPTHGRIDITVHVPKAGRYRLQWHNRIGEGSDTTEHNDTWVKFPDAADYYGLKGSEGAEIRRYPKPICEDADAMAAIASMPEVDTADCVVGSTTDGWLKVYSSGASDWKWSTHTSDSDASDIMVEFDDPGTYTLSFAARGDHHLIDRIVLHEEGLGSEAQELSLAATPCE